MRTTHLSDLENFCTLSFGKCAAMVEAASVCLESQNHQQGVVLEVYGSYSEKISLFWNAVDLKTRQSWQNLAESVEEAAYGLAIAVIYQLTPLRVIKQSFKGSGFDYWLGEQDITNQPFQEKARLEVSGILKGTTSQINQRQKEKINQTKQSDKLELPVFVIIVAFNAPKLKIYQA